MAPQEVDLAGMRVHISLVGEGFRAATGKAADAVEEGARRMNNSLNKVAKISGMVGAVALGMTVLGAGAAFVATRAAASLEAGYLDVARTTGMAGAELKALQTELEHLGTTMAGISMQNLQQIAVVAGQLGIRGSENIANFTKHIAMLEIATDLTASQAAVMIARITNVMGDSIKDVGKVASAINELGNTTTATASEIVSIMVRLSGAAKTFGLTTDQLAALSASLRDVGVGVEVAGTAMSRILLTSMRDIEKFAIVSDMSMKDFKKSLVENPIEALQILFEAIAKMDKFERVDALQILNLEGIRTSGMIQQLAEGVDNLAKSLKTSESAYKSGASHIEEFNKFAQGFNSQVIRMKNSALIATAAIGEQFMPRMKDFVKTITRAFWAVEKFAKGHPKITKFLTGFTLDLATVLAPLGVLALLVSGASRVLIKLGYAVTFGGDKLITFTKLTKVSTTAILAMKAAAVGLAAVVGWEIGKLIGEIDPVAKYLQEVFGAFMGGPTDEQFASGKKQRIILEDLSRAYDKLAEKALQAGMDPKRIEALALLNQSMFSYTQIIKSGADVNSELNKTFRVSQEEIAAVEVKVDAAVVAYKKQNKEWQKGAKLTVTQRAEMKELGSAIEDWKIKLGIITPRQADLNKVLKDFSSLSEDTTEKLRNFINAYHDLKEEQRASKKLFAADKKVSDELRSIFFSDFEYQKDLINRQFEEHKTAGVNIVKLYTWRTTQIGKLALEFFAKQVEISKRINAQNKEAIKMGLAAHTEAREIRLKLMLSEEEFQKFLVDKRINALEAAMNHEVDLTFLAEEMKAKIRAEFAEKEKSRLEKTLEDMQKKYTDWTEVTTDLITGFFSGTMQAVGNVVDALVDGDLKRAGEAIKNFFKDLAKMLLKAIAKMLVFKILASAFPGFFDGGGGGALEAWARLRSAGGQGKASGGMIDRAGLYRMHAGEFVIPNPNMGDAPKPPGPPQGVPGFVGANITIVNVLDPAEITRMGIASDPSVIINPVVAGMASMRVNPQATGAF